VLSFSGFGPDLVQFGVSVTLHVDERRAFDDVVSNVQAFDTKSWIAVLIQEGRGQIEIPLAGTAGPAACIRGLDMNVEAKSLQHLSGVFAQAITHGAIGQIELIDGVIARID